MAEKQQETRKAFGRTLSDLWLDGEEGRFHPAETQILDCAARGIDCVLGDKRPARASEENRVRAELLRFIALGGDAQNPLHEKGLTVIGAFIECGAEGLDFEGTTITENLWLRSCTVNGRVLLRDATTSALGFSGSQVDGINADRLVCNGSLHLKNGFITTETVYLRGAVIKGNLSCSGGRFRTRESRSLVCDSVTVEGSVFIRDRFSALGAVEFGKAIIGNGLFANNGRFLDREKALYAQRCRVENSIDLGEGFKARGPVSFQGAKIANDMICSGGLFKGAPCLTLRGAQIAGTFFWQEIVKANGELNLSAASCQTLNTNMASWEKPDQVRLDNFTYKGFSQLEKGANAAYWKSFLERQPENHLTDRFRPNPYAQLASVLDNMGYELEAKSVRVEQSRRQSNFTRLYEPNGSGLWERFMRWLVVFWNFIQGALVDYGYRPGKAVLYLIGVLLVGAGIYHYAALNGVMTPTHPLIYKEAGNSIPAECSKNWVYPEESIRAACEAAIPGEYSTFNALVYSADVALPIVNLRMENDWSPRVVTWPEGRYEGFGSFLPGTLGGWVRAWEWLQITLGWLLSLLFASAIGGIIRR
ncbi:hypothetical protein ACFQ14_09900 [Pseudahrensia aquimaris]|uniref:Membrane-associated oxidoreductase n=1 Tax=Pseudahrensia aquimaris TaxID=744461 RepID=A0ABW3FEW3_9HYPH